MTQNWYTFSDHSDYQNSDASIKTDIFSWKWFAATRKLLIETLREEIEQVVMEKCSNWKASYFKTKGNFFQSTGVSGFWHKGENQRLFHGRLLYRNRNSDRDQDERIEASIVGEKWVATPRNSNILYVFWRFFNEIQQIYFRNKFVFCWLCRDYHSEKNWYQKTGKFQLLTFMIRNFYEF